MERLKMVIGRTFGRDCHATVFGTQHVSNIQEDPGEFRWAVGDHFGAELWELEVNLFLHHVIVHTQITQKRPQIITKGLQIMYLERLCTLQHWKTIPKILPKLIPRLFWRDQIFRNRDFFPRPNFFKTETKTFFSETKFSETETLKDLAKVSKPRSFETEMSISDHMYTEYLHYTVFKWNVFQTNNKSLYDN